MSALLLIGCQVVVRSFTASPVAGAPPYSVVGHVLSLLLITVLFIVPIDFVSYRRRLRKFREAESLSVQAPPTLSLSEVQGRARLSR